MHAHVILTLRRQWAYRVAVASTCRKRRQKGKGIHKEIGGQQKQTKSFSITHKSINFASHRITSNNIKTSFHAPKFTYSLNIG